MTGHAIHSKRENPKLVTAAIDMSGGLLMPNDCLEVGDRYLDAFFSAFGRNLGGVIGFSGPFGTRKTPFHFPLAQRLIRDATSLCERLKADCLDRFGYR